MQVLSAVRLLARLQQLDRTLGHDEFKKLNVVVSDDNEMNGVHYGLWVDLATTEDEDLKFVDLDDIKEDMFILIG